MSTFKPMSKFQIPNLWVSLSLLLVLFSVLPLTGQAARLDLISKVREINVGDQFEVELFLDAEGESINAVEGTIIFPDELLEIKEIRDGNTIVSLWVKKPKVERSRGIIFSGITPGCYSGEKGKVLSIIFYAKNEGRGTIQIIDGLALLNDGLGTKTKLSLVNSEFTITSASSFQIPASSFQIQDAEPPESFVPETARDESIFNGKWFLVFVAQDKGSGIAYYAIRETRREIDLKRETDTKEWITVESPYVLKDQKLRSYIYVKAVDKTGNERIAVVEPEYPMKWYEVWWIWTIIGLGIAIVYLVGRVLWKKLLPHQRLRI